MVGHVRTGVCWRFWAAGMVGLGCVLIGCSRDPASESAARRAMVRSEAAERKQAHKLPRPRATGAGSPWSTGGLSFRIPLPLVQQQTASSAVCSASSIRSRHSCASVFLTWPPPFGLKQGSPAPR